MTRHPDYDVLVVGGGPVGLLLGNLLAGKGLRTLLVEKNLLPPAQSMAIGVTPPSLELLARLELDKDFIRRGVRVDLARVHEGGQLVGELRFANLDHPYPFILAIPQAVTIALLEERLRQQAAVTLRRGTRLVDFVQNEDRVTATLQQSGDRVPEKVTASWLIGCDGHRSQVREAAGLDPIRVKHYPVHFLMADFDDETGLGDEAHLFFSRHGSLESFPLPHNRRRWIIQTEELAEPAASMLLIEGVYRQTGHALTGRPTAVNAFGVRRFVCRSYFSHRVVLCGDAAHVMSPVGGQGMNTGFADAEYLAEVLDRHCCRSEDFRALLTGYDHCRRIAFQTAADRAERGMWLGTRRGSLASGLRFLFIKGLLSPLFVRPLPAYFAMLTIPRRSLETSGSQPH